jgi:hypothetical protein
VDTGLAVAGRELARVVGRCYYRAIVIDPPGKATIEALDQVRQERDRLRLDLDAALEMVHKLKNQVLIFQLESDSAELKMQDRRIADPGHVYDLCQKGTLVDGQLPQIAVSHLERLLEDACLDLVDYKNLVTTLRDIIRSALLTVTSG